MEDITKYLIDLFNKEQVAKTNAGVAGFIAKLILGNQLPLGTRLYTQKKLGTGIGVTPGIMQGAGKILKNVYKLIVTKSGGGSFVISTLSPSERANVTQLLDKTGASANKYFLDRIILSGIHGRPHNTIAYGLKLGDKLSIVEQEEKLIPGLITQFTKRVIASTAYVFSDANIYYNDDYHQLLVYLYKVLVPPGSLCVTVKPFSAAVTLAVRKSRKKGKVVGLNPQINWLDELENCCMGAKVKVVHIALFPLRPMAIEMSSSDCKRLLQIQKTHGFIILVDERFPQPLKPLALFEQLSTGGNQGLVYLRPVSLVDKHFHAVNIVAAPEYIMKKLKVQFAKVGKLVDPAVGYTLLQFLQDGKLQTIELNELEALQEMILAAKRLIRTFGILKEEFIINQDWCFFYLEPDKGNFPKNINSRLTKAGFYVMHRKTYSLKVSEKRGILISVAGYQIRQKMEQDLVKLMLLMKKAIK